MVPNASHGELIYLPIFRDGRNEREVMEEFSGLNRFGELREGKLLYPLLELTDTEDLQNLNTYRQAGDKLLIELPEYLAEQENHALKEEIDALLERYGGQNEFYREHADEIDVPVISGRPNDELLDSYDQAKERFDEVAVRLLLSKGGENGELAGANELGLEIDSSDFVILDLLDTANLEEGGYSYLDALSDIFAENRAVVANALNVYEGEAYNWGPEIAGEYGFDGFGDFAVGGRYPPIIPSLHEAQKKYRQYGVSDFEIREFEGETYEEAVQELEAWGRWRQNHCPFCQQLGSRERECTSHMAKQARVGHYIHSVFENDLEWLTEQRT
ncbi:hypothetical protein [Halobaculum sp. D14]|uniref:hypothetical protein n=1 Tax=Halobaculum sp. D14 TaxID=3421642 RepID=UPI003EC01585